MRTIGSRLLALGFAAFVVSVLVTSPKAQQGGIPVPQTTPIVGLELPVEVETELSPATSLKQAPLWKELIQLLQNPYAPPVRRPGFGVAMPPLNVYPLDKSVLIGEPLRLRTSDGEIS